MSEFEKRGILKSKLKISEDIFDALKNYSWPGNIRELQNVLERLVILSSNREIKFEDLPESLIHQKKQNGSHPKEMVTLEKLTRNHIEMVLSQEKNLEKVAEILGITPVTLWRKRKEYGLD